MFFLSNAVRILALCLCVGATTALSAQTKPIKNKVVQTGSPKEQTIAKKLLAFLEQLPGYKAEQSELYRSRKAIMPSLSELKNTFVFGERIRPIADIERSVPKGDFVTWETISNYKHALIQTPPSQMPKTFDGWILLHQYSSLEGKDQQPQSKTMVYLVDKELSNILDGEQWYGFDYGYILSAIEGVEQYLKETQIRQEEMRQAELKGEGDTAFAEGSNLPQFPGGREALGAFVSKHLIYPEVAQEMGIEGRVLLSFVVGPSGQTRNIKIAQKLEANCDLEALRVLLKFPKWQMPQSEGKALSYKMLLPFKFALQ